MTPPLPPGSLSPGQLEPLPPGRLGMAWEPPLCCAVLSALPVSKFPVFQSPQTSPGLWGRFVMSVSWEVTINSAWSEEQDVSVLLERKQSSELPYRSVVSVTFSDVMRRVLGLQSSLFYLCQ